MQAAQDAAPVGQRSAVQQRVVLFALVGVDDPALHTPGGGVAELALEVLEPCFGGGQFQPAELVEAGDPAVREGEELVDRVAGEFRHGLGRVGLEDQAGGV
jgi:hypothetical protein